MKIGMVTGSRAEWGLLFPLVREIVQRKGCSLELFITGSHHSPAHGNTWIEVVADYDSLYSKDDFHRFCPHNINVQLGSDSPVAVCKTMGLVIQGIADSFDIWKPECLIVLGDRYESFAAATAAHIMRIPIVHIHGGEVTEGAYDDALRHGITKMSSLHLVAAEPYRNRVIQLGEEPDTVFNCGALGLEALDDYRNSAKKDSNSVVVCWHPVTAGKDDETMLLCQILHQLLQQLPKAYFTVIGPNADPKNHQVRRLMQDWCEIQDTNSEYVESLPRHEFLTRLAAAKFIIGNSSAGIIEAPALGVPTINVGSRQKGRLMASSIYQANTSDEIEAIIRTVDIGQDFSDLPYGRGGPVAKNMLNIILENQDKLKRVKRFYDKA